MSIRKFMQSTSRNTWLPAISKRLIVAAVMPVVLGGCVATYSARYEDPIQAAPDAAMVCRYNWSVDEPYFRSENVYSYHWAPASRFGHHNLDSAVRALTSACPQAADDDERIDAQISTHYLRHVNTFIRGAMALPMAYAMGLTLGFIPIPLTDYFAVCLEIKSTDGLRHAAIAQGQLDSITNVWGASNHRYKQGKDERREKLDEVMRELTVHAWHKAWNPAQSEGGTTGDCREALDAIARGSASNNAR